MQKAIEKYREQIRSSYDDKRASYLMGEFVLGILEGVDHDDFVHFPDDDEVTIAFIRGWMEGKKLSKNSK